MGGVVGGWAYIWMIRGREGEGERGLREGRREGRGGEGREMLVCSM